MFKPLEMVGDTAFRTTDQKVRGSNPFERAESLGMWEFADKATEHSLFLVWTQVFCEMRAHLSSY